MKIEAKDLKVGMTIKDGVWTMLIDSISNSAQKNGTPTVIVEGLTKNTRKNIHGKVSDPFRADRTYKHLTKVNVI